MYSKKGLHPVIGATLLFLVAIVSVIEFSTWYSSYLSDIMVDVEQTNSLDSSGVEISHLAGSTLYIDSGKNMTLETIKVDGEECLLNEELDAKMNEINITSCLDSLSNSRFEIFILGDEGSSSSRYFYKNLDDVDLSSSIDCSNLDGGEWIEVQGNNYFNTDNFCVMKWEAKAYNTSSQEYVESGGTGENWADLSEISAISSENARPWTNISFGDAYQACNNLGERYSMISNVEWMTIARDVENNSQNWDSGEVGVGSLYIGNSNQLISLNGSNSLSDVNYRIHTLSNSEKIWDMSGNLWTYVDVSGDGTSSDTGAACQGSTQQFEWFNFVEGGVTRDECNWQNDYGKTNANNLNLEVGPFGEYNENDGVGVVRGYDDTNVFAVRGGYYNDASNTGIYAFSASLGPSELGDHIGFRCSYS